MTCEGKRLNPWKSFLRWSIIPLKWLMQVTLLPYMGYVARECLDVADLPSEARAKPYESPQGPVNPLLLMRAVSDRSEFLKADPERAQAELNSCMEAIMACDSLQSAGLMMFVSMIGDGRQPDDAMTRVMANYLELGMYVERRLQSANAGELPTNTRAEESADKKGKQK